MDTGHKIQKYTYKLKNTNSTKKAEQYQKKLRYYHRKNFFGGSINDELSKLKDSEEKISEQSEQFSEMNDKLGKIKYKVTQQKFKDMEVKNKLNEARVELKQMEGELDKTKKELEKKNKLLSETSSEDKERLERMVKDLSRKLETTEEEIKNKDKQIEEIKLDIKEHEDDIEKTEELLKNTVGEINKRTNRIMEVVNVNIKEADMADDNVDSIADILGVETKSFMNSKLSSVSPSSKKTNLQEVRLNDVKEQNEDLTSNISDILDSMNEQVDRIIKGKNEASLLSGGSMNFEDNLKTLEKIISNNPNLLNNQPIIDNVRELNNKLGEYILNNKNLKERGKLENYMIKLKNIFKRLGGKAKEKKIN